MNANKCFLCGFVVLIHFVSIFRSVLSHIQITNQDLPSSLLLKAFRSSRSSSRAKLQEPPQYMLDLYKEVANDAGEASSPLPYGASVVRGLQAVRVDDENSIQFSLGKIPDDEAILEAEVHIHNHQIKKTLPHINHKSLFRLNLFVISAAEEEPRLLASQIVGGHFEGWRKFTVGDFVRTARNFRRITFRLDASTLDEESVDLKIHQGRHNIDKPLLVLFNKGSNRTLLPEEFPDPKGKSVSQRRFRRSVAADTSVIGISSPKPPPAGCELRDLYIDFESIGWSSWVVYPTGYNAYMCSGRCEFPMSQDLHPTNHATIVSIVNYSSEETDWVSHPCCVPTTYKNLALLYYDEEDTVILKQFDRMVATQCGCR